MSSFSVFVARHIEAITERWADRVAERLGLDDKRRPQLINDMPEVLDDLIRAMSDPAEPWRTSGGRAHARQRVNLGVDIGGLSEEFGMVGETIMEVASEKGAAPTSEAVALMLRFLSHCAAESVNEFARLSEQEIRRQSAEHFSFVAHELRTPLQAAKLAAALLEEPSKSPHALARLHRSLERLSGLIDNSLVVARLSSNPTPLLGRLHLASLLDEALDQCGDLGQHRGIRIDVEAEDFDFEGDSKLLISALTNLIVNALKFSRKGGRVLVRASAAERRVRLEVCDSCGGLPEGAAQKMFESFTQVGSDRSGFGLGLLIVRQAVEAHGGEVRVEDHPGDGCAMIIDLPRWREKDDSENSPS